MTGMARTWFVWKTVLGSKRVIKNEFLDDLYLTREYVIRNSRNSLDGHWQADFPSSSCPGAAWLPRWIYKSVLQQWFLESLQWDFFVVVHSFLSLKFEGLWGAGLGTSSTTPWSKGHSVVLGILTETREFSLVSSHLFLLLWYTVNLTQARVQSRKNRQNCWRFSWIHVVGQGDVWVCQVFRGHTPIIPSPTLPFKWSVWTLV